MSKEAMKLALEALEYIHEGANNQGPHTGISWRCVSNKAEPAITALRQALANEALDKMAENARELGLDYEPARDSGIVTAGGADPRTQRTWDVHSCGPDCTNAACVAVREAVKAEREACATLCDNLEMHPAQGDCWDIGTLDCAAAIRARSNT